VNSRFDRVCFLRPFRLYERVDEGDKYEPIALDLASISLKAPSALTPPPQTGEENNRAGAH